jgi:hypothetical protein
MHCTPPHQKHQHAHKLPRWYKLPQADSSPGKLKERRNIHMHSNLEPMTDKLLSSQRLL